MKYAVSVNGLSIGYSRKNPHPFDRRHAGKSHWEGVNCSGNTDKFGFLNLQILPRGLLSGTFRSL